ncbi:hypothetical protein LuPra_05784 [Luteitalea pratensis]|uniref:Glucose/Sorbosone dehydrogenase domain-containing protein n=1 Tax=Luteitalea pratensis TaxID=1855912 RepID=A0A143PWC6_LUTPR|nr:PQQ-dependent sugar dehydrogenase [Luteitalea pratensis]AMY12508.1 hypothetical protein LuPra_05784 [Luteitalea pratensis]
MRLQSRILVACAGIIAASVTLRGAQAPPQKPGLTPPPPAPSDLRVRVDRVGVMPTHINPTSPVVAGDQLLLVDQAGTLSRWDGHAATTLLTPKSLPPGVRLLGGESLINVAADRAGTHVYAVFVSSLVPKGVKRLMSPRDPDGWYVLVQYQFDGQTLTSPRPIVALQMRSEGHTGGGLVVADDDLVLFAVGDNGDSYEDGRGHGQDAQTHLAKIMRITPSDGAVSVAALGVRAAQRLAIGTWAGERWLTFVDPGGWISEEVNGARLTDFSSSASLDFGWGRHPVDGKAREGTYDIDRLGNSAAQLPDDEPGFVQPIAQVGRATGERIAVSGPVPGGPSFSRITLLFGDLVSGRVFATTGPMTARRQAVLEVGVVDAEGKDTTLKALAGNARPDPRFFTFPDGTAGVLLEKTGEFFRVTELR